MSAPTLAAVALFAVSAIQACNPGTPSTGGTNTGTVDPDPVAAEYEATMDLTCESEGGPDATVTAMTYSNGALTFEVEWVGGCEAPYFELCTHDGFGDGDDPALFWKMYVDQTHEQCNETVSQTLVIDIQDRIDEQEAYWPYADGMHITVGDQYAWVAF